jgi:hypothetical protein
MKRLTDFPGTRELVIAFRRFKLFVETNKKIKDKNKILSWWL